MARAAGIRCSQFDSRVARRPHARIRCSAYGSATRSHVASTRSSSEKSALAKSVESTVSCPHSSNSRRARLSGTGHWRNLADPGTNPSRLESDPCTARHESRRTSDPGSAMLGSTNAPATVVRLSIRALSENGRRLVVDGHLAGHPTRLGRDQGGITLGRMAENAVEAAFFASFPRSAQVASPMHGQKMPISSKTKACWLRLTHNVASSQSSTRR